MSPCAGLYVLSATGSLPSLNSRQSSSNTVLDAMTVSAADDSILLDLVESLQGDFPDCIAFDDDPFEHLAPMTMQ